MRLRPMSWHGAPCLLAAVPSSRTGERWLLIESREGDCELLAGLLEQQGGKCDVVVYGSDGYDSTIAAGGWTGIVYDARGGSNPADVSPWTHPEKKDIEIVLQLVRSLQASKDAVAPRLWILSSSAVSVLPSEDVRVAQAPLWGLCRTLMLEHPETSPVLIDVGSDVATVGAEQQIADMVMRDCRQRPGTNGCLPPWNSLCGAADSESGAARQCKKTPDFFYRSPGRFTYRGDSTKRSAAA